MSKRSLTSPWMFVATLALAGAAGCSTGSTDGPEPQPTENGLASQRNTFTIAVFERSSLTSLPLRGVTVVFDKPGGARVEGTTGADGRVTFADVDWSRGEGAFTAFDRTHTMLSVVGLDATTVTPGSVQTRAANDTTTPPNYSCFLSRLSASSDRATVSGTLANKQAPSHFTTLSASVDGSSFQSTGATYSIDVAKSRPFALLGLEWVPKTPTTVSARGIEQTFFRWAMWDQPALSADATIPLDFATAKTLAPIRSVGRIMLPGGANGSMSVQTKAYVTVTSGSSALLGNTTRSDVAGDMAGFDYQMEHVEIDGVEPITEYVIARDDGASSYLERPGYPPANDLVDGFLEPPADPGRAQPLFEDITFGPIATDAYPRLVVRDGLGVLRWIVDGPRGKSAMRAPALGAEATHQLGNADRARLVVLADRDATTGSFARAAAGRELSVSR